MLIADLSVRREERSRLQAALEGLAGGGAGVVQLVGQAGIGKSFLLGWLVDAARERGFWVGVGRARELDGEPSFGVFAEALEVLSSDHGFAAVWRALDGDTRTVLGAVVPALAGDEAVVEAGVAAYRMRRAMRLLLAALAERPLVLALDDLHWADQESLLLLAYLLDHLPASVLVAVGYRLPGLPARVQAALGAGRAETIELAPLSRQDTRRLLPAEEFDERAVGRLWGESGGIPLYLRELARAAYRPEVEAGDARAAQRGADAPGVVVASVAEQLRELGEREDGHAAVELLGAGSVLGEFAARVAGEVAGLGEQETLAALSVLVGGELVRSRESSGRYEFAHPVVRRAVYQLLWEGRRLTAHARAAFALRRDGASAREIAPHLARAAAPGDRESAGVLVAAAREEMLRSPAQTARWLTAALAILPDETTGERQGLMLELAAAQAAQGDLVDSDRTFAGLLADEQLVCGLRVRAVIGASMVADLLGRHDEARALGVRELERLGRNADGAEVAVLRYRLASGAYFTADWEAMRDWACAALDAPGIEAVDRGGALAALAIASYGLLDVPAARRHAQDAAGILDLLPDRELAARLEGLGWLAWSEYSLGCWAHAARHASRAIDIARGTAQQHLEAPMHVIHGMTLLAQGNLARAREAGETARESAGRSANHLFTAWALTLECMVEMVDGEPRRAVQIGEQAVTAARQSHSPWASVADCYLAEAYLQARRPRSACQQLLGGGQEPRLAPTVPYHVHAYQILAEAAIATDDLTAADRWAHAAEKAAKRLGLDAWRAEAWRAQASVLLARGEPRAAGERALAAADAAGRAQLAIEAARAMALAAQAHTRLGETARARELYGQARALAPAGALRAVLPQPPGEPPELSAREREMAELAGTHTNRQIAEQLGVSEKTVEATLRNAFGKLGVSSRGELARIVESA